MLLACFRAASKNLEDAIKGPSGGLWPIPTAMMRFIQSYFLELVSNTGIHSEIVACGVDVLAFVQPFHHVWRTSAQTLISHANQAPSVVFSTRRTSKFNA